MPAVADLTLWPSERRFSLPGEGTRSLIFKFDEGGEELSLGAVATTADGSPFAPGSVHPGVRFTFWAEHPPGILAPGTRFIVWYDGDVGEGVIRGTDPDS